MDISYRYSLEDIVNSEQHAELINGTEVIEDRTSVQHNNAVSEIATALKNFIDSHNGTCKVFIENVALYVNELCDDDKNFFLPDVMTVCQPDGIKDDGVHVAPLFVAEITSESTRKHDYCGKLEVYRKIGVNEYWIIDLQRNVIYKYLKSEDYIPQTYVHPESMKISSYPGLLVDTSELFS